MAPALSSCTRFAFLFAIPLILQAARRHRFARWHLHFALPLLIRPFASSARYPTVQVAWLPNCWSPTFLYLFSLFCCYADGLHVSLNQLINGYPQRLCVFPYRIFCRFTLWLYYYCFVCVIYLMLDTLAEDVVA